jgi:drug/metabolite transporter (DMT)-like permease
MTYTQMVAASALGFIVFGETPTLTTAIGSVIVAASGIALVRTRS